MTGEQMLMLVTKDVSGLCHVEDVLPVGFGLMVGVDSVLHS